ncbi:hypothetical protein BP00DRAFT_55141 [Aspergillus indologenus CBS 114.80]|uniref:4Fe-4S ferredoxin-type domain-containing protein n=1 Tax=Aspergillus indologenus CBS 114.80 TaxID=1450541 RepID=A0A2V5IEK7_9EURO|nr:hypothetical protein BP00DRAFT_55141 [Aspergillus indologenus CBS 114.80]
MEKTLLVHDSCVPPIFIRRMIWSEGASTPHSLTHALTHYCIIDRIWPEVHDVKSGLATFGASPFWELGVFPFGRIGRDSGRFLPFGSRLRDGSTRCTLSAAGFCSVDTVGEQILAGGPRMGVVDVEPSHCIHCIHCITPCG